MILLDTDHLSVLKYDEHPRSRALRDRVNATEDSFFATTIVSALRFGGSAAFRLAEAWSERLDE